MGKAISKDLYNIHMQESAKFKLWILTLVLIDSPIYYNLSSKDYLNDIVI